MRQFAILLVAIVALVAGQASAGTLKDIFVAVKLNGLRTIDTIELNEVDDGMTVRELGEKVIGMLNLTGKKVQLVMENYEDIFYSLDKTLKEAWVRDRASLDCWVKNV